MIRNVVENDITVVNAVALFPLHQQWAPDSRTVSLPHCLICILACYKYMELPVNCSEINLNTLEDMNRNN